MTDNNRVSQTPLLGCYYLGDFLRAPALVKRSRRIQAWLRYIGGVGMGETENIRFQERLRRR